MTVNATTELAQVDPAVASMVQASRMLCEAVFERVVRRQSERARCGR